MDISITILFSLSNFKFMLKRFMFILKYKIIRAVFISYWLNI